jgi:hypothetical protein
MVCLLTTAIQKEAGASCVVYDPTLLHEPFRWPGKMLGFYSSSRRIMSNGININESAEVSGLCTRQQICQQKGTMGPLLREMNLTLKTSDV